MKVGNCYVSFLDAVLKKHEENQVKVKRFVIGRPLNNI